MFRTQPKPEGGVLEETRRGEDGRGAQAAGRAIAALPAHGEYPWVEEFEDQRKSDIDAKREEISTILKITQTFQDSQNNI